MNKKSVFSRVMLLVLLVTMTVGIVGCSNGDSAEESTGSEESGVKVVTVSTGNSFPPFCYLDENENSVGYDVDVLHELDERLEDYEFDIQLMDFSTQIVSIDSGATDMMSNQLVKSEIRKEKYLFPENYYCLSPMSLAVTKDSGIYGMEEMAGKSIDQNPSAYEYQMLLAYNNAHPGEEIVINAVSDQTSADQYKKVSNGQVDAALTYQATFEKVNAEIQADNLMLTDVVMCEDTYIMFNSEQGELCDAVDAALGEMYEDGTMSEISLKWFNEDVFDKYADMITITVEE